MAEKESLLWPRLHEPVLSTPLLLSLPPHSEYEDDDCGCCCGCGVLFKRSACGACLKIADWREDQEIAFPFNKCRVEQTDKYSTGLLCFGGKTELLSSIHS